MTQATSNGTTSAITMSATLTATVQGLARADCKQHGSDSGAWASIIAFAFPSGTTASFVESSFKQCSVLYVNTYVAEAKVFAVTAKDVKDGKGTQTQADLYDATKRAARSAFGMGTNRAMKAAGVERPKQNTGPTQSPTTPPVAPAESTTILPPSFSRDMDVVRDMIAAFQVQHGARLNRAGKDAIGEIAAAHGKCIEALLPKGTNGVTPPATPALGDALLKLAAAGDATDTTH